MASLNDPVSVKEETDLIAEEENNTPAIKSEPEDNNLNINNYNLNVTVPQPKIAESPFENIQIVVKKESPEDNSVELACHTIEVKKEGGLECTGFINNVLVVIENCGELTKDHDRHQISDLEVKTEPPSDDQSHQAEVKENDKDHQVVAKEYDQNHQMEVKVDHNLVSVEKVCKHDDQDHQVTVKQEIQMDENVSYDFPTFDSTSINSEEGGDTMNALGNVETCLQEDVNIKCEYDTEPPYCHEDVKEELPPADIKLESGLTVTDTHLTPTSSNAPLDTTDPKKLLVMKISKNENGLPEIIQNSNNLQETFQNGYDPYLAEGHNRPDGDNDDFQLNSITGNVLTLEQQALSTKLITCPLCPKTYKNKHYLYKHLKIHEKLEKNILARKNGIPKSRKTRALNKKLKEQKRAKDYAQYLADVSRPPSKSEGYKCTCGKLFQRRTRMEACLRTHNYFATTGKGNYFSTTGKVTCLACKKQFKSKHELEMHKKKMHRKKFPCKFCPTDYKTKNELFKHLQIHQEVQLLEYKVISQVIQEKQVLRCVLCPQTYTELSELKTHVMLDHKAPYTCPNCKNNFPQMVDFINHTQTYHPDIEVQSVLNVLKAFSRLIQAWKCEECKHQFVEPDKLALHQIEKHGSYENVDSQFQCEHCRRVFISQKALTSHKRVHHKSVSTEDNNDLMNSIMCLECRKMCKDMTALTSHMRLHSPDRKFPCKFCDFRFATKEKRKAHAEIHTGDMKYVCFICEYQCSSERRLKLHKRTPKHYNMQQYLLTGKPLVQESTSKQDSSDSPKKKAKKRLPDDAEKTESPKKRKHNKSREEHKEDKESSSSSDGGNSDANESVACDICGEEFPNHRRMALHKQDHPFIEILADGQDKPERIFFK